MVMASNKQICVNGETFSYAQFSSDPNTYLPKIRSLFRASTLNKKQNESDSHYYSRIFGLAYYSKHLAVESATASQQTATAQHAITPEVISEELTDTAILNKLGIVTSRRSAKQSQIVFKSSGNEYRVKNSDIDKLVEIVKSKAKYERSNVEIKFGIEFEFIGLSVSSEREKFNTAMKALVGTDNYCSDLRYTHNDGSKWILGVDSSLHAREDTYRGYELTTPILTLCEKDIDTVRQVIELVYIHLDGHPNKTCGTHVHISFDTPTEVTSELCFKFAKVYRKSEDSLFDKLVPTHRRENNNQYCLRTNTQRFQRFCKLNLENVTTGSKRLHLEFRQLNGTLDLDKVIAWVKLQKLFIEVTLSSLNEIESLSPLTLENAICDESFNMVDVENFMIMSNIAV